MKKILVVDDDGTVLFALSRLLSNQSTAIVTCETIECAEAALASHQFDVVIADIRLSGMQGLEGLELLSYVRNKQPTAKVIIMTGYGTDEMEKDAYDRGAYHYYEKPVDFQDLTQRIRDLGITV